MTADTDAIPITSTPAVITTKTSSITPGIACFATAFGFGSMDLTTMPTAIATGCCKGLSTLTARIGGAAMTTVWATTDRQGIPARNQKAALALAAPFSFGQVKRPQDRGGPLL
jgi:hypothetical protein